VNTGGRGLYNAEVVSLGLGPASLPLLRQNTPRELYKTAKKSVDKTISESRLCLTNLEEAEKGRGEAAAEDDGEDGDQRGRCQKDLYRGRHKYNVLYSFATYSQPKRNLYVLKGWESRECINLRTAYRHRVGNFYFDNFKAINL